MHNGFVEISGSKIYWEKEGTGDPLVFIHADGLDLRQWDKQIEYFSKKFTVIRYDVRGFGKSELPKTLPYSFSEDLYKLLSFLQIPKVHVVGLSLGAAISIDFVLTHPGNVASLVLADSGISGDGFNEDFIKSIHCITDLAKKGCMKEAKKAWLELAIFDYSRTLSSVWKEVQKMVSDTSGYRWYGDNQPGDILPPAIQRISQINVPTLVAVGQYDIEDFQRKSRVLHEKIRDSQLVTIPQAGHLSNMDNPDEFNRAIESFLPVV